MSDAKLSRVVGLFRRNTLLVESRLNPPQSTATGRNTRLAIISARRE
jgi:hypothetical protein